MESPSTNPDYRGTERRRHRVYMTRNTEYHFRDGVCVAVRDRRTGDGSPVTSRCAARCSAVCASS